MKILAFSDIHSPKHLDKFVKVLQVHLDKVQKVDIVLIAGDLMHKGNVEGYKRLREALIKHFQDRPIIACPGNEDFEQQLEKILKVEDRVRWLVDQELDIEVQNLRLNIYGTKGVLDKPTPWQAKHIKNIDEIYRKRLQEIRSWIIKSDSRAKILLSHYAVTYHTLVGENESIWQHLGTNKLDDVLGRKMLIIHGHAHKSQVRYVRVGDTHIVNVAFPEVGGIFLIELTARLENVHVLLLRQDRVDEIMPKVVSMVPTQSGKISTVERKSRASILDFLR